MNFAKLSETNEIIEYPLTQWEIQHRFPNTSFPIPFVPPDGYAAVKDIEPPATSYCENVVEETPEFDGNRFIQSWRIEPATLAEIEARTAAEVRRIREHRTGYLASSDWTQLPDAPVDAAAWAAYRQALRDITTQAAFPWDIQWPEKPV